MDIADAQLVANAKKDKEQFKALYKKYISKVYNYFWYRVGHDNDVAEDLAQETFVRAYLNLQKFKISQKSGVCDVFSSEADGRCPGCLRPYCRLRTCARVLSYSLLSTLRGPVRGRCAQWRPPTPQNHQRARAGPSLG